MSEAPEGFGVKECDWVYESCWYGRGSKDWDTYRCTVCGESTTVLEDEEPNLCLRSDQVALRKVKRVEKEEMKEYLRLKKKYGDNR